MTTIDLDSVIDTAQESNDAGELREALAYLFNQRRRSTAAQQAFSLGISRLKRLAGMSISAIIYAASKDAQTINLQG
jgi:hypothetical protein